MMSKKLILLLAVLLTACAPTVPPTDVPPMNNTPIPTPANSGIEGQALIGPACPVMQVGTECPDQPYQAALTVNSLTGEKIVQFQTDEQGRFHITLPPGEYILHPELSGRYPFASEQNITVSAGQFTQIIVTYDSGIR